MRIEELISMKNDPEEINIDGLTARVSALKKLIKDGYEHILPYKEERTFSIWGKRLNSLA